MTATTKRRIPKYDLSIKAGSDWQLTLIWKDDAGVPKNLTGYTAQMHIRRTIEGDLVQNLATGGSGITITAAQGKIVIDITNAQSKALGIEKGVYDLFVTDAGSKLSCILQGEVLVEPPVTRP